MILIFSLLVYNTACVSEFVFIWPNCECCSVCLCPPQTSGSSAELGRASPAAVRACVHWVNLHMPMTIFLIFALGFIRPSIGFQNKLTRKGKTLLTGWKPADRSRLKGQGLFLFGLFKDVRETWRHTAGGRGEVMWAAQQSETEMEISE